MGEEVKIACEISQTKLPGQAVSTVADASSLPLQGTATGLEAVSRVEDALPTVERLQEENAALRLENENLQRRVRELETGVWSRLPQISKLRCDSITIGKKLGQGAFGVVYRGQWRGIRCALKFIEKAVADELTKECGIMDRIDHPNVVKLYGVVEEGEVPACWPQDLKLPAIVLECMEYKIV